MQSLTWLDLLAANFAGFALIAGLIFAVREARKARSAFGWGIVAVLMIFGATVVISRAGHWYDESQANPRFIVPPVAQQ
jgi:hypothetical protein